MAGAKRTVLVVAGFVADTYCEIERSYVELCAAPERPVEFLWLVPDIGAKINRFQYPENRTRLREPVYVSHLRAQGVPFVRGNISKWNAAANWRLFRRLFAEHDMDAVYTHFGMERFWAALFAKLAGKITIWNEHWYSLGTRHVRAKRLFYRLFVDHFVAVSGFIARTLPATARVHVVPNAVEVPDRPPAAEEAAARRRKLGLPPDRRIVLMVAGFRPEKRHGLALDICERVLDARRDVLFVFLGGGVTRPAFLAEVAERGLGEHVLSTGHVENAADYYPAADLCMLTSRRDAFGYCVIEAMRERVPMVAFASGGPAEVIRHGETGLLIPDGDVAAFAQAVLALLADDARRAALGENGYRAVRRDYSREVWKRRLLAVLDESTARGPDAAPLAADARE